MYAKRYRPCYDRNFRNNIHLWRHIQPCTIYSIPCTLLWLLHPVSLSLYDKSCILSWSCFPFTSYWEFLGQCRVHCAICSNSFHRCGAVGAYLNISNLDTDSTEMGILLRPQCLRGQLSTWYHIEAHREMVVVVNSFLVSLQLFTYYKKIHPSDSTHQCIQADTL